MMYKYLAPTLKDVNLLSNRRVLPIWTKRLIASFPIAAYGNITHFYWITPHIVELF